MLNSTTDPGVPDLEATKDAIKSMVTNAADYQLPAQPPLSAAEGNGGKKAHGALSAEPTAQMAAMDNQASPFQLQTVTAAELMAMELPEPRWTIPGLVPEGLTLLAGKPKKGKSWFALAVTVGVAAGLPVLGSIDVEPGEALYIGLEDNLRRLQSRIRMLLQGAPAPAGLHTLTAIERADGGGIQAIDNWLQSHPACRLVVIDTLARFRPHRGTNGNNYDEDAAIGHQLQDLAMKHRIAVMVVHHQRKQEADDPFDTVSGTHGLTGAADAILVLVRKNLQDDGCLFVTGRDMEQQELAIRFDATCGQWAIVGEAARVRISPERQTIIDLLAEAGPLASKEISDRLGKEPGAVRKLVCDMYSAGQITKPPEGGSKYCLPDDTAGNSGNIGNTSNEQRSSAQPDDEFDRLWADFIATVDDDDTSVTGVTGVTEELDGTDFPDDQVDGEEPSGVVVL